MNSDPKTQGQALTSSHTKKDGSIFSVFEKVIPKGSHSRKVLVQAVLCMVMAHFCFTVMMALIKYAGRLEERAFPLDRHFGTWEAVLFRSLPMAVCFLYILKRNHRNNATSSLTKLDRLTLRWLIVRGVIGSGAMACLFYGSLHVPLAVASLFSNASVFFIALLAAIFLKERITLFRGLFIAGGFVGVALTLQGGLATSSFDQAKLFDYFVSFSSGILSAIAYFSVRRMHHVQGAYIILSLAISGVIMALVMFAFHGAVFPRSSLAFLVLAASAVPAILGQIFMTWSFQHAEASVVSPAQYTGPLFAAVMGVVFFGEGMSGLELCGAILVVVCGVVLPLSESVVWRLARKWKGEKESEGSSQSL